MKIDNLVYSSGTQFTGSVTLGEEAQWVLVFGSSKLISDNTIFDKIRNMYPSAYIMGCSTAGEILKDAVMDDSLCITAVYLEKSRVEFNKFELNDIKCSDTLGEKIINSIPKEGLRHIFVLSEGLNINGSKLVEGFRKSVQNQVPVTGGLSGDGAEFKKTYILANDYARSNQVVVASFYGNIKTGCASIGGWDTFGIERLVTKAEDNILYEIDGKPALDLYKEYLGDQAKDLPASGLLFPLCVREKNVENSYVRTILAIDEEKKSLIFAGDIPVDSYRKLMKANYQNLINGSMKAAELSNDMLQLGQAELAILISCIGRKLVLKQMVDEEVIVVGETVGNNTKITGFYSYGEIAPYKKDTLCELHNQTMTITLFAEE